MYILSLSLFFKNMHCDYILSHTFVNFYQMKNDNAITLNTIICRNETKFISSRLGEDIVMMDMENGDFISINKVGADIWNLSQKPLSVNELIAKLLRLYNASEDQCVTDTMQFIQAGMEQTIFTCRNANA